jgi:hypothetical protein
MKQRLLFFDVVLRFFLLTIFILPFASKAQKENNVWYFGNGAGIDFNSGSPVALTNGSMFTTEGCASIADSAGNLLFYTDGVTVYNKVHSVMVNGNGLLGGNSSTESAIIVKQPGSSTLYYIFTTPNQGALDGLNYSVVDVSLQGGMGEVTSLNNLLHAPIGEKVCATHHSNGTDYWIVAHEFISDAFYAFQLSSTGMNLVPVISNVGIVHNGYHGYLKFTPDGTKIGLAVGETNNIELFDFDRSTGVVSNPISFPTIYNYPYGVEFSPDNSKFYICESGVGATCGIYQFDMLAGSPAAIIASGTLVSSTPFQYMGPLQLGPDGKIYSARYMTNYIGCINNPNAMGMACNYVDTAVFLISGQSMFGLPNQIPKFDFLPMAIFSGDNHICPGTCTDFNNLSQNATSYVWSFPGGNPSVSVDVNPMQICYTSPGQYSVTLIATNANGSDTLMLPNYITVYPTPPPQGILQNGDTLFANQGSVLYQWFFGGQIINGATNYFYVATESGNYSVVATDENGCEVEAVINNVIAYLPLAVGHLPVTVFPNPSVTELTIQYDHPSTDGISIEIFNAAGQIVYSSHERNCIDANCKIDILNFVAGLYCIKLSSDAETVSTKFMKQ